MSAVLFSKNPVVPTSFSSASESHRAEEFKEEKEECKSASAAAAAGSKRKRSNSAVVVARKRQQAPLAWFYERPLLSAEVRRKEIDAIMRSTQSFLSAGGELRDYAMQFLSNAFARNDRVVEDLRAYTAAELPSVGLCVGSTHSTMIVSDKQLRGDRRDFLAIRESVHEVFFQIIELAQCKKASGCHITTEDGERVPQIVSDATAKRLDKLLIEEFAGIKFCQTRILDINHPTFPEKLKNIIYSDSFDILDVRVRTAELGNGHAIVILLHPQYQLSAVGEEPITYQNQEELLKDAIAYFVMTQRAQNKRYVCIDLYKRQQMAPALNPLRIFYDEAGRVP